MCPEPPVIHPAGPVIKGRSVPGRTTETPFRVRDFGPERTSMDAPIKGFGRGAGYFVLKYTYVYVIIYTTVPREEKTYI